jgi:iduronate 2-sulfatase
MYQAYHPDLYLVVQVKNLALAIHQPHPESLVQTPCAIGSLHAQIGSIFEDLKKNGLWDNTIVVLTSDHGYQLGEHFQWGKVTLFEVCNRVPLLIRVPGQTQSGSASQGLVELVDLFPTLAELCGVKTPKDIQGMSLVSMLKDSKSSGKEAVYTVVTRGKNLGKAIRTDRWRYARWPDGEELYDLENDIEEHTNLVYSNERKKVLGSMRNKMNLAEKNATSSLRRN